MSVGKDLTLARRGETLAGHLAAPDAAARPEAAADAFERSVAFFEMHLSPKA